MHLKHTQLRAELEHTLF